MLEKKSKLILLGILIFTVAGCSKEMQSINSLKDLEFSKIGIYTGSEYDSLLEQKLPNSEATYFNSYSDQISALKAGKIDGFLTDEPLSKEIIKNNSNLKILKEKLSVDSYAFAISPKSKWLEEKVNNELLKMNSNGKLKEMESKWMSDKEENKIAEVIANTIIEENKILEKYTYDDSKGVITFATVSGSAPFSYMKDNEIVGYDIDIINYICMKLGYKLKIVEMSFDGIIPALKSGKIDMAGCSIIVTEERKKSVLFSVPNYTGGIVMIVRG